MKKILLLITAMALTAGVTLVCAPSVQAQGAQGAKIKEKAKDLKKQTEGKPAPTNAPPQKPKPPK